jgi:hypothetical protein
MKLKTLKYLLVILALFFPSHFGISSESVNARNLLATLIQNIPARPFSAISGSEFAGSVFSLDGSKREQAILAEIMEGNLPEFLRKLKPVRLTHKFKHQETTTATIFVMPDYLAIGSDKDYLLIPMSLYTATAIASKFGFILPTKKMVDAIFGQSLSHFTPIPMGPCPQMSSTQYYLEHNRKIREQRLHSGFALDALAAGDKKDVVLTNHLARTLGRIAIYGWHRLSGVPIQPLATVHSANYADYSHGVRLVSDTVLIDGEPRSIYDVLEDPKLARVLSDEGAIPKVRQLMTCHDP